MEIVVPEIPAARLRLHAGLKIVADLRDRRAVLAVDLGPAALLVDPVEHGALARGELAADGLVGRSLALEDQVLALLVEDDQPAHCECQRGSRERLPGARAKAP